MRIDRCKPAFSQRAFAGCRLRANGHVQIDWQVVNPDAVRAVDHAQLAGLQAADTVASGVRYAAELNRYDESASHGVRRVVEKNAGSKFEDPSLSGCHPRR